MTIRAGILSDTHLQRPDSIFKKLVRHCFAHCDIIIHAGDITNPAILDVFHGKQVFAVHGNMCETNSKTQLPAQLTFTLGAFTIGLTHGAQLGSDIESSLWALFPEADCIIYGHTHQPHYQRFGTTLFLNPGSFKATGRYGAPGTYAILEVAEQLHGHIFEVPQQL